MFWQITKRNRVNGHHGSVDRDMRVHSITIVRTKGVVLANINIDQHRVQMSSTVRNGANRQTVKLVIIVSIVILEPNNNFIRKFTNQPNVMTYNRLAIAHAAYSVHLLMLNVSLFFASNIKISHPFYISKISHPFIFGIFEVLFGPALFW